MNTHQQEILSKLTNIFRKVLRSKTMELSEDMAQGSVRGWDSLNQTQILLAVEEAFSIEFSMDEVLSARTVGNILRLIESKLKPSSS